MDLDSAVLAFEGFEVKWDFYQINENFKVLSSFILRMQFYCALISEYKQCNMMIRNWHLN